MADTAIAITAGSGTNVDTRTEGTNGNHRQVVVLGDPATNAGVAPVDATAGLKVDLGSDNDVTNAGTFAVQVDGNALTALQLIDDVVYADDADWTDGTSKHALVGGLYQSTPQTVTDGDVAPFQVDSNGKIIESNSAAILADTANMDTNIATIAGDTTSIDGKITACDTGAVVISSGTVTANLGATDNAVLDTIAANTGTIAGAVSTEMQVDVVGSLPAGTNAIGKLAANSGVDIGDVDVTSCANTSGDVAHDGADSGNPLKVGGKAYSFDGTAPGTAVAEGDRANFITTPEGRQYVETTHPNYWSVSADYAAAQTNTTVKAAPGAGLKLYITDVIVSNGAVAGNITLLDGSGGTVLLELYPAINGGLTHSFRTPIALTANTLLAITSTTVTTHSVTICGFIAA